jgi:hypothetical protein
MSLPSPVPEPPSESQDRRIGERTQCFLEVAVSSEQSSFLPATVLDLSTGGVKLLADPPPAPGETLRLTFLAADGRLFQMVATVVHYIEHGTTWAVGCRFGRELDEREIEALL